MEKIIVPRCKICDFVFLRGIGWTELSNEDWIKKITLDGTVILDNIFCPACEKEHLQTVILLI